MSVLYFPCWPLCKWSLIIMVLVFIQCYEDMHGTCVSGVYYDYDVHKRNSIGTVDRQPETMQASGSISDQSGISAFGIRIQSVLSIGHWPHSTANHLPRQVWLYTEQSIFNIPKFSSSAVQLASVVWHQRKHTLSTLINHDHDLYSPLDTLLCSNEHINFMDIAQKRRNYPKY